jgi:hypothetical protein
MDLYSSDGGDSPVVSLREDGNELQAPWPLVRKRTLPTERPPPVGEF